MIVPDEISEILDSEEIDYVKHRDGVCDRWLVVCSLGAISIELLASGEHLIIRTGPVAEVSNLCKESRHELLQRAMEANRQQMIGRYCGVEQIDYEIGLAFPGRAALYPEQLIQALRTAAAVAHSPGLSV
jgi:hypothetical protein